MTVVRNKDVATHHTKSYDFAVNGREMLVCDPANTYARRSCPVLEGDAAIEFLERVEAMRKIPDPSRPSKEEREEWKKYFKEQSLRELYEKSEV